MEVAKRVFRALPFGLRAAVGDALAVTQSGQVRAALERPLTGTPFVVATSARSGSNYLRGLIDAHPDATVYGELFNHLLRLPPELSAWEDRSLALLTDGLWGADRPATTTAVGFKLMHRHNVVRGAAVWPYLRRQTRVRIVHLLRADLLSRYVSDVRARRDGAWVVRPGQPAPDDQRFPLDPAAAVRAIREELAVRRRFARRFADHDVLEVRYEDLSARTGPELGRVFDFLGLAAIPEPPANTEVRRSMPVEEEVTNWPEVAHVVRAAGLTEHGPSGLL